MTATAARACRAAAPQELRRQRQRQPPQQRERGHTEQQVQRHDERLELPGDGQHAEQRLDQHDGEQDHASAEAVTSARAALQMPRSASDEDQQPERAGCVAMDHLAPGLADLERPARAWRRERPRVGRGARGREVTVAARPVRAAESRAAEAHVGAQHDHARGTAAGRCR